MIAYRKFGVAAAVAAAALMATAGSAGAHQVSHNLGRGDRGAVFVQTDNTAGDTITVYDRGYGGTLTAAGTYETGGVGADQSGSTADHLASQGSLVYDAATSELFAVNAGSDTVSVFDVQGDRLHLRQVIGSGGVFPSSITVHGDLVYVLNALGGGTIQGYRLSGGRLAPIPGSARALGTTPTVGSEFTTTPGDIAFSPDGRDLLITTKGSTNAIDVFTVGDSGLPSAAPTVNSEPGTVPFAVAFEGADQVDVGEAAGYVASFELTHGGTLTPLDSVPTYATATCWIVADGPWLFVGNAGSASESSVLSSPFGGLRVKATTSTDPGTIDAATSPDGRYLYVQTGANGIVDEFAVGFGGALTKLGSVTITNGAGGEGIATS